MRALMISVLVLTMASACGDGGWAGLDAPDAEDVPTTPESLCCLQWEAGPGAFSVPGCWSCAGVVRCMGTRCQAATTLPLCKVQPVEAWTAEHPNCD